MNMYDTNSLSDPMSVCTVYLCSESLYRDYFCINLCRYVHAVFLSFSALEISSLFGSF